jgi:hypothetical protein
MTTEQKISTAQWMLERQLYWSAQAEVKVGAMVTIDIGMLAGLFAAHVATKTHTKATLIFSAVSIAAVIVALFLAAICLVPRLKPAPHRSGLFFGEIAAMKSSDFVAWTKSKSPDEVLDDWLFQTHRNAQITTAKHMWVRKAMLASFIGAPFWLMAILSLVEI